MIKAHAHRITSLEFVFTDNHNDRYGTWTSVEEIFKTFSECKLPRLKKFDLIAPPTDDWQDDESDEDERKLAPDDGLYHIYTEWDAPTLKQLTLHELVPRVADGTKLTCLDLTFDTTWHLADNPLTKIMFFIKSQPTLEHLKISMGVLYDPEFRWEETIDLPYLRYLAFWTSVDNNDVNSAIFFVPAVIRCLSVPAVETMEVHLPIIDRQFTMESCFPQHRTYPNLRKLFFALFHHEEFQLELSPFETIFAKFPQLTDMTVHFAHSTIRGSTPSASRYPPPPLEKIRFIECWEFDVGELMRVIRYLRKNPQWSELKEFKVEHSPIGTPAQLQELARFIPRERIHIVPYVEY